MNKHLLRFGPVRIDLTFLSSQDHNTEMWQWKLDPFLVDETLVGEDSSSDSILQEKVSDPILQEKVSVSESILQEKVSVSDSIASEEDFSHSVPEKSAFSASGDIVTVSLRTDEESNDSEQIRDSQENLLECRTQGFYDRKICKTETGYAFSYVRRSSGQVLLSFLCSEDGEKISLVQDLSHTGHQMAFEYLTHVMPYALLQQNILIFHGVLMEYHGKGIILSAPSGTGKTTHARLWRDCKNALILNGDRAACYQKDGIWTGFGMPWSGSSGEQINREVPIHALVIIERGDENQADLLKPAQGFREAYSNILSPTWDSKTADRTIPLLSEFIEHVPVIHLHAKPDTDSVDVLYRALHF